MTLHIKLTKIIVTLQNVIFSLSYNCCIFAVYLFCAFTVIILLCICFMITKNVVYLCLLKVYGRIAQQCMSSKMVYRIPGNV